MNKTSGMVATALTAAVLVLPWPLSALAPGAVSEAVEFAARKSGRVLTPAAARSLGEAVARAARRYGDTTLDAMKAGGVELAEAAARHGDDVWFYAARVPAAAPALARRTGILLPLARRTGGAALELEVKAPGLAEPLLHAFGDRSVHVLLQAEPDDLVRLAGGGRYANDPTARRALYQAYRERGRMVLERLDWKRVMAAGLSTSMVVAAYRMSGGAADGLRQVAAESPETFMRPLELLALPVGWALAGLLALFLLPTAIRSLRKLRRREER